MIRGAEFGGAQRVARSVWVRAQDRRRRLVAACVTAALYLAVALTLWLVGALAPSRLELGEGTVRVSLEGTGSTNATPLGSPTAPPEPETVSRPEPASPAVTASPASPASPQVAAPKPEAASANAAAASDTTSPQPQAATSSGTVYRGSEKGNSLDTAFGASAESAGRSLYSPIYLYMPLPSALDDRIYRNVASNKDGLPAFLTYYAQVGVTWRLRGDVPLDDRPSLWIVLEHAGYDLARAEYKTGRFLVPVMLEFAVSAETSGAKPALVAVRVVTSSGSKDIDEAVMYGFRQAAFFNKTGGTISGRFAYRFE